MTVVLEHKEDFHKILDNYEPSDSAKKTLKRIPLVIFLGVTGAGRNTIINHLVATGRYHFIISDTTRPPKVRNGEQEKDGVNYHFKSEEEVLKDLEDGAYLEAEVIHEQQVSGISIKELERAEASGKIPVNEVDFIGTVNILKYKPDTHMFFIVPPSYDVWIERLNAREVMSETEFKNRAKTAVNILKKALESDRYHFVINDNSDESARLIDRWVHGEHNKEHDKATRNIAEEILAQLENNL